MQPVNCATGELVPVIDLDELDWTDCDDALTSSSYPDCEANVFGVSNELLKNVAATGHCGRYSAMGRCPDGAEYRKVLLCGRDWCRTCGESWSDIHRRRFARWLPKVQQISRMGYLVVTLPEEARARTQLEWALMAHEATEVLKDFRFSRGLRRWHWFGELWVAYWQQLAPELTPDAAKKKYEAKTPEDARRDGVKPRWHPHMNFIVDGDDVPTERAAFTEWAANLREQLSEVLGCSVNVHYEYADPPAQKVHITKYVLRGTFLDSAWDPAMAIDLHGFTNSGQWGSPKDWDQPELWSMADPEVAEDSTDEPIRPELVQLHNGECPCCTGSVKWGGIERTASYRGRILDDFGAGYYRVRLDVFDAWDSQQEADTEYQPPG